jgi:hypothetical protein
VPSALTLVLYDVTTLYFEIQRDDEYRKPGLSKERRLEPQTTVGLLVYRSGFPLEVTSFEGNKAEGKTIVFAALAISRHIEDATKISIRRFVQKLEPIRSRRQKGLMSFTQLTIS